MSTEGMQSFGYYPSRILFRFNMQGEGKEAGVKNSYLKGNHIIL